jgi:ubiquinol oxidase
MYTQIQERLSRLTLDNNAVARVERERIAKYGDFKSPLYVKLPFDALCLVLDVVYNNRPIQVCMVGLRVACVPCGNTFW